MNTKPIITGLAGFGVSGKYFHAPFLTGNPHFALKKIFKRNVNSAEELLPNVSGVPDFAELLSDKEIELIVITLPNNLHYEYAEKALKAGKHVIIEKPFTVTSAEGKSLIKLANEKNLILSVYQNRRWDGDFLTIKKMLGDNTFGKLAEYEAHFDRFRNYIKEGAWKERPEGGSGILYDLGSHLIDQTLYLFGKPKSVFADLRVQRDNSQTIDSFEILLEYGYLKATLKAGMLVRENARKFVLRGFNGTYIKKGLDPQEDALRNGASPADDNFGEEDESCWGVFYSADGTIKKIKTERGEYSGYYKSIFEAIRNGKELIVKPEEALDVIKIIEICHRSAQEKKRIDI